jgi:hypothetical protein
MPALAPKLLERFNAGTLAIYVIGEITYRDAFGEPRKTWYRLYHSVERYGSGRLKTDKDGNGYT